jgi:hypothetical protein
MLSVVGCKHITFHHQERPADYKERELRNVAERHPEVPALVTRAYVLLRHLRGPARWLRKADMMIVVGSAPAEQMESTTPD